MSTVVLHDWVVHVHISINMQEFCFNLSALPSVPLAHHLQLILQLLCCYQDALPLQFRDHHIDYNSLLEGVRVARQCTEEPDSDSLSLLQLHLIRLLVETDVRQFNWTKEVGSFTNVYRVHCKGHFNMPESVPSSQVP